MSGRRRERTTAAALLAATALLRLACVATYRVDSDEPQHLHVAWGWAHGLLQYRDVFDNHAPLFHILCAPLVAVIGERPDIVILMRLAMLPLYAIGVYAVYVLGTALYSEREGLWAAVLTALFPGFFLTGLEFRSDDLWAALWLLALAVLVTGPVTVRRSSVAGLLLGFTLATSVKTVLLLFALTVATPWALAMTRGRARSHLPSAVARCGVALVLGATAVPLVIVWLFASYGALDAMLYGTIAHNVLPGLGEWHAHPWRPLLLGPVLLALQLGGRSIARSAPTPARARRRAFVFFVAGGCLAVLVGVWPIVTPEDFLAIAPLVVLLAVGTVLRDRPAPQRSGWRSREAALLGFVAVEVAVILAVAMPWERQASAETAVLRDVLELTRPREYVMDLKGETVFRRRAYPYVLEAVTKARLRRGLLADSIPERLLATRAPLVTPDDRSFPPRARAFMNANYVSVGRVRVLGRLLDPPRAREGISFDVRIPGRYALVTSGEHCALWLDDTRYTGPRHLVRGRHELRAEGAEGGLALIWARASKRGFSPFARAHACA